MVVNAPLIGVILMLVRQVKLNLIIDPQVLEHEFPTEGEPFARRNRALFALVVHGLAALDSAALAAALPAPQPVPSLPQAKSEHCSADIADRSRAGDKSACAGFVRTLPGGEPMNSVKVAEKDGLAR